jgi:hypothetical protein
MSLITIKGAPEPRDIIEARIRYYASRKQTRQLEHRIQMTESGLLFLMRIKQIGLP